MQGIGHNFSPLRERIFSDPEVSVEDVLQAVSEHLEISNKPEIERVSSMAVLLSSNKARMPASFDNDNVSTALNLLSRLDSHNDEVAEIKTSMISAAENLVTQLKSSCKPLDDGLSPLEKALRAGITDAMCGQIDSHNSERTEGESLMTSLTLRSSSGTRATLSLSEDHEIEAEADIPREFCAPCPKLIAAAIKNGKNVPGVKQKRKPTLRITTK